MAKQIYVIGVDYGTDSVRSVIVDTANGNEVSSAVFYYPRWKAGKYCNASLSQFRQHPLDYSEGLTETIKEAIAKADVSGDIAENILAISIDTTGSTPVAVNNQGVPLALLPEFAENPNAMFVLWKDHTGVGEAAEINQHATKFPVNYLKYVGGIYSSEWFWSKFLHILRADEKVASSTYAWVEHCDWIPFLLTGGTNAKDIKASRCAAGHKALWAEEFRGLPPEEFFSSLDPLLAGYRDQLFTETYTSDKKAGTLSEEWANKLGLSTDVAIGIGAFDAHFGAVGGQIEPYYLSKVMGTSTCDILVAPNKDMHGKLVAGICGQVNGSVIPGMAGLEAGQSAFGDAYAWYKNLLMWPIKNLLADNATEKTEALIAQVDNQLIKVLSEKADLLPLSETDEYAVDWLNGRRTPDANQLLKGAFFGLNLGSNAVNMFKALVEATCFGAKKIVDQFNNQGVQVEGLIGLGGVAKKSPYIMQMMADVLNMPIKIHKSEQTCAIGAAMFAATVAGIYPKVEDAMQAMGQGFDAEYHPNPEKTDIYSKRYQTYIAAGNFIEDKLTPKN
ncbi:ribulokinase [Pedobacter psychrophilus]|uniref:Ribulokinase n=1 Tax=Pedobacter psychrophilus TaxID=1826909 RepID=A0A179DLM0_9SPHI|nr:ribulokinase [Pedobacter psychrophilus]OAQ41986.1 ribulokinase [Pedobacter psychrophilus]